MDYEKLISNLTPEMVTALRRAVELGKWPDGKVLTQEQKEHCMEAVINYEQRFLPEEERVGYINRGSKAEGEMCDDKDSNNGDDTSPLKWS